MAENEPKAEALVSNDLMLDKEESKQEERYLDYNYNSGDYGYNSLSPYYQSNAQLLRKQMLLKQQLARQQLAMQQMSVANTLRMPQARQSLTYSPNR